MHHYSLLDLSPIPEGGSAADALANTLDLACMAEGEGYHRFWLAEHHNMPGIASAATAVVIGHVAAGTKTIRVGAGGIMLPNHAPLTVAEAFGTLATLHPGRIDLGLGRAPTHLAEALEVYRATFRPSDWLAKPYAMMAVGLCAAETDDEAEFLRSSQLLAFARLRTGRPGPLPRPSADLSEIPPAMRAEVEHALSCAAVGSPATVEAQLAALVDRHAPDEVMLTGMIHDHAKRLESFRIGARAMRRIIARKAAA